ncbi:MAG: PKD domain-containing protein, partial [candidate division Zixibacteria bacterium]|nr:PKD domain-containing protein [candidate division Zixibacteria bacterium]
MPRLTTLVLGFITAILCGSLFAANAARVGNNVSNNQAHMVPIESRQFPLTDGGPETPSAIGNKSDASYTALGYYMSPGVLLGTTSYDTQANMRQQRQVAVGADGRVHFVWTSAPLPLDVSLRSVYYTTFKNGILGKAVNVSSLEPEKIPGRFCTVDVFQNRGLVVNHYGPTGSPITTSALDVGSASNSFSKEDPPADTVNCQNIYAGGATAATFLHYIWPVAAADQDGSGKLVVHIAASEAQTSFGFSVITYFRGVSSGVTIDPGMYGTCGTFIDSCNTTGYDIAADPYSDRVVIAYPRARGGSNRENNDLAYRLSTDLGANWGPVVNVTNYPTEALERCAGDMSVLFANDNCFHVIYVATIYDSVANTISDQEAKLWHWSSCNPTLRSLVLDADNSDTGCNTPMFEYNVCKVNLTQCYSSVLNDTLLYAVYSRQLGTTADPDCSNLKYFNQEVFLSPSSTWGETWGAPVNLTNTKTNGCLSGFCADDGSSSSAKYVEDSLRIEYMEDLDAGSNAGNEGGTGSFLNPIKFISYPCVAMAPYQILTCTPNAIEYPFHANTGATATQDLLLTNEGNESINWTSSLVVGDCPVTIPASGIVPAGYTNSATITATVGPKGTEGLFHNTIRFTYQDGAKTLDVPVEFYVFDLTVHFSAAPTHGRKPLFVSFNPQFSPQPDSVRWLFGDGETSMAPNPIHKYQNMGVYAVTLNAYKLGSMFTLSRPDLVKVSDARADFAATARCGGAPLTVTFTDLSTSSYPLTDWHWDFGDSQTSTEQNPTHQFASIRTYDIKLIVVDSVGADTLTKDDYVTTQQSLSVDFTGSPTRGRLPLTVMFDPLLQGAANEYYWDFGDGDTSTLANPIHVYQTQGTYSVKFKARLNLDGCDQVDSIMKSAHIVVNDLKPEFVASPTAGYEPLTVQFTDSSKGNPTSWYWDFGDGNSSSAQDPSHIYSNGTYDVFLRVTNALGVDSLKKLSYIHVDSVYVDLEGQIMKRGWVQFRPGFPFNLVFFWANLGTTPAAECELKVLLPPELVFSGIDWIYTGTGTYSGYSFSGDTLVIPLQTMAPSGWFGGFVQAYGQIPETTPIGDTLICKSWLTTTSPETHLANNDVVTNLIVVGSWDPNDKIADPGGKELSFGIAPDQRINYTVQFEN